MDGTMLDETTIAKLKAKFGTVYHLAGAGEEVVIRGPTRGDLARFYRRAAVPKRRLDAAEELLIACCVHPTGRELAELMERKPAAAMTFIDKVLEVAGVDDAATLTTH
jgi:hypothetical protein